VGPVRRSRRSLRRRRAGGRVRQEPAGQAVYGARPGRAATTAPA
jgi:hypothetical protein